MFYMRKYIFLINSLRTGNLDHLCFKITDMYDGLTFPVYRVCTLYSVHNSLYFLYVYLALSHLKNPARFPVSGLIYDRKTSICRTFGSFPVSGRIFDWISKYQVGYYITYPALPAYPVRGRILVWIWPSTKAEYPAFLYQAQ